MAQDPCWSGPVCERVRQLSVLTEASPCLIQSSRDTAGFSVSPSAGMVPDARYSWVAIAGGRIEHVCSGELSTRPDHHTRGDALG